MGVSVYVGQSHFESLRLIGLDIPHVGQGGSHDVNGLKVGFSCSEEVCILIKIYN